VRTEMVHACNVALVCGAYPGSETRVAGDAGTTEASRPSLRPLHRVVSNRYMAPQLAARRLRRFGVARAQFTGSDPAGRGTYIPGAIDRVRVFWFLTVEGPSAPVGGPCIARYSGAASDRGQQPRFAVLGDFLRARLLYGRPRRPA